VKPPRFNAHYDIEEVMPVDVAGWKLELASCYESYAILDNVPGRGRTLIAEGVAGGYSVAKTKPGSVASLGSGAGVDRRLGRDDGMGDCLHIARVASSGDPSVAGRTFAVGCRGLLRAGARGGEGVVLGGGDYDRIGSGAGAPPRHVGTCVLEHQRKPKFAAVVNYAVRPELSFLRMRRPVLDVLRAS
jgi:hypothetical protein